MQQLEPLGRRLLQDAGDDLVGLATTRHVLAAFRIEAQDVLADLLVEARTALLAERAGGDELVDHGRRRVAGVERVVLQVVLQRLDDVRHRVEADHVGGSEGARAGAAELLAGEVVDHVVGQAIGLGLLHRRQHAGDADAVGDEVRRVLGAHHRLAERRRHEGLELVEDLGLGGRRGDQFHQRHVARRVEEVDAAKTRLDRLRQHFRELGDAQARGVAGDDGVRRERRRDLRVEVELPVHALGDRLDDQVAFAEQAQVLFIVRLLDSRGVFGNSERRRLELLQPFDRLRDDAVLRPVFRRQVEQHHRHADVDQVRGDLRTHDAGAEHGDLADVESIHRCSRRRSHSARIHVCVRPSNGVPM